MADLCDNLDAYLADELSLSAAEQFSAHLASCDACREAVDQQRWIDGLLGSAELERLESPPAELLVSLNSQMATAVLPRSIRRPYVAAGLAAAAALVVVGGIVLWSRQPADKPHGTQASSATAAPATEEPEDDPRLEVPQPPRATLVGGPDLIVVPVESRHPNVSVFRVYPTFEPAYAAQTGAKPPSSFDAPVWPDFTNGG